MSNNEYPEKSGATEKLDYLASCLSSAQLISEHSAPVIELSVQFNDQGRCLAAGFKVSVLGPDASGIRR